MLNMQNDESRLASFGEVLSIVDVGSFFELNALMKNTNVIIGYATINGKLVYLFSQKGAVSETHIKKINTIYSQALKMGAPIIGVLDSSGLVIEESYDSFNVYGEIITNMTKAKGVIPQLCIINGKCLGVSSLIASLSDFAFALTNKSMLMLESPALNSGLEAKTTTIESMSNIKNHAIKSSLISFLCEDMLELSAKVRCLITLIPSNNLEAIDYQDNNDDINRLTTEINEKSTPFSIINAISDDGKFMEVSQLNAPEVIIGFSTFNGITTGIIANNGKHSLGTIEKTIDFINFCNSFNISILSLTDIDGFDFVIEKHIEMIKKIGELAYAYSNASVAKVNLIINNAIGCAGLINNSKCIGADIVIAFEKAVVSPLKIEVMDKIIKKSGEDDLCYNMLNSGSVDNVIVYEETRKSIIYLLEMLESKKNNH